jgi:hypothetical protein
MCMRMRITKLIKKETEEEKKNTTNNLENEG